MKGRARRGVTQEAKVVGFRQNFGVGSARHAFDSFASERCQTSIEQRPVSEARDGVVPFEKAFEFRLPR